MLIKLFKEVKMIEKEIETWSDFIEEFLKDGGVVYENKSNDKRDE